MKIILLILGLFFSGGLFASSMDKVCSIYSQDGGVMDSNTIKNRCERNNIFVYSNLQVNELVFRISEWCRYDREINYELDIHGKYRLTCVLYSNEPRTQ